MDRIFLSYSHKDAGDIAEFLYSRLTGAGYKVWKDDHSLALGSSFPRELSQALTDHDYFLVLLTAAAIKSDWVKDEIDMAIVAKRQIIPILLEPVEIPLYLKRLQCLKMEGIADWMALHELVNHIGDGKNIPRAYNMSGYKDIEVKGILILANSDFGYANLNDPSSISNIAQSMTEAALPYIKQAGAGIVPHGHSTLACSILAYLSGKYNLMPKLYYTHKSESGKFCINSKICIALQNIRDLGIEYRSQHL